jgi:hypothetical protein
MVELSPSELCDECKSINIQSIARTGGHLLAESLVDLLKKAETCHLCRFIEQHFYDELPPISPSKTPQNYSPEPEWIFMSFSERGLAFGGLGEFARNWEFFADSDVSMSEIDVSMDMRDQGRLVIKNQIGVSNGRIAVATFEGT